MRTMAYILTRRRVFIFALFGIYLYIHFGWTVFSLLLVGLAAIFAARIASRPNLSRKLRLRSEKKRHGVARKLTRAEKSEILALDAYSRSLREAGVSAEELLSEPLAQAWRLVRRSGLNDASESLRAFRQSLPTIAGAESGVSEQDRAADLQARLRREVAIINAAEQEIRNMGSI